jgi:perosamine synthetase
MIPYGKQTIDDDDIAAVVAVLKSDWLTTGPKVGEFEAAVARYVGATEAIAVNSGTSALHAMMNALGVGPGDEVIVPTMTFAATANSVVFEGGTPIFVDVLADTLLIDPDAVEAAITPRTKAIVCVDYAGQPCDYTRLEAIASRHGLPLLTDGCHSLGARHQGRPIGSFASMTAFSFHPVKPITTGEGGMIVTNDSQLARQMRIFRNHGIHTDARQREQQGTWFYEMQSLGYNYRLCDLQCALGLQQLSHLDDWLERRRAIADSYDRAFARQTAVRPLTKARDVLHAYHIYVVRLMGCDRAAAFAQLRSRGIGANVHYVPVHMHPFYQQRFGTRRGLCPVAEAAYEQIVSLPVFPRMTDEQIRFVVDTLGEITAQQQVAA